ncbi:MAG: hypothetical protein WCD07_08485 [Burkholderiales bacterium]
MIRIDEASDVVSFRMILQSQLSAKDALRLTNSPLSGRISGRKADDHKIGFVTHAKYRFALQNISTLAQLILLQRTPSASSRREAIRGLAFQFPFPKKKRPARGGPRSVEWLMRFEAWPQILGLECSRTG